MFGYVCPVSDMLDEAAQTAFHASYCGVCHNMSIVSRFAISYECAFLALLYDGLSTMPPTCRRACHAVPFRRKTMALGDSQRYAADINTLLAYYKLRDDVRDHGSFKARLFCSLLYPSKRAVAKRQKKAAAWIEQKLSQLNELEQQKCHDVEALSVVFAELLQGIGAPGYDSEGALGRFFYDLGRWIYIVDALTDYKDDQRAGRFNALSGYPTIVKAREAMEFSLWHGLSQMEKQLELLNPTEPALRVCKHILYDVLPAHTVRALGQEGGRETESLSDTGR